MDSMIQQLMLYKQYKTLNAYASAIHTGTMEDVETEEEEVDLDISHDMSFSGGKDEESFSNVSSESDEADHEEAPAEEGEAVPDIPRDMSFIDDKDDESSLDPVETHEPVRAEAPAGSEEGRGTEHAALPMTEELSLIDTTCTIKYGLNNKILDNSRIILQFSDRKTVFFISEEHTDNILRFIEFKLDSFSSPAMMIHNYDLETEDTIALIYSSIVTNSLINDHVSRLLDTVVIKSHKKGILYMKFKTPFSIKFLHQILWVFHLKFAIILQNLLNSTDRCL